MRLCSFLESLTHEEALNGLEPSVCSGAIQRLCAMLKKRDQLRKQWSLLFWTTHQVHISLLAVKLVLPLAKKVALGLFIPCFVGYNSYFSPLSEPQSHFTHRTGTTEWHLANCSDCFCMKCEPAECEHFQSTHRWAYSRLSRVVNQPGAGWQDIY